MKRIITSLVTLAATLAVLLGSMGTQPAAAQASPTDGTASVRLAGDTSHQTSRVSAGCSSGRCTVYLSKSETRDLGNGRVPAAPSFLPTPIRVGYYALAYAHRFFAAQYASRGWCSLFRLSIYPWESQGYAGYAC